MCGYVTWIFCERFWEQSRWSNHWRLVTSGVQKSDDARGDCLIVCPLRPTKLYYWEAAYDGHCYWIYAVCKVIIWRHIGVFKPIFWRSLLTQSYYSTRTLLTRCCTMCHCNEHKLLSALQVKRPEKNTATNATTEQFIQQLQKYPATR